MYQTVISIFNLQDKSVDERIEALCSLSMESILKVLPPHIAFMHMVDGDLIKRTPRFDEIGSAKTPGNVALLGSSWCKGLMIGDCQFDVSAEFDRALPLLLKLSDSVIEGFNSLRNDTAQET